MEVIIDREGGLFPDKSDVVAGQVSKLNHANLYEGHALGRVPHKRGLGQGRDADVAFRADTGRKSAHSGTFAWCQELNGSSFLWAHGFNMIPFTPNGI